MTGVRCSLRRRWLTLLALSLLTAGPWLLSPANAAAQGSCDTTVTSLADSGAGTLRDALANPNAANICFSVQGTITLASTLSITRSVGILGSVDETGVPLVTISGNNAVQAFNIDLPGADASPVQISNLIITNGNAATIGGGVYVASGAAVLSGLTIENSQAQAGGGVYNQGSLTISNSSITGNTANNGLGGGIVNLSGGSLTLQNTSVINNSSADSNGGGISNTGTLVIQGGQFQQNYANNGGAIYNNSRLTITDTAFGDPVAGGNQSYGAGAGLYNDTAGTATISQTLFLDNYTFYSEGSPNGAGIANYGTLQVSESTFTGNTSEALGGAIYEAGSLTLADTTISANDADSGGSGLYNTSNAGALVVNNTIISGDTTTADCAGCTTLSGANNLVGGSAMLGPVANNGNNGLPLALETMMPLPGSPAIGAGNPGATTDTTDQRGFSRLSNGSLDIGAVQTHYSAVTFITQPTGTTPGATITPAVAVQVVEKDGTTTNYPQGVPVSMNLLTSEGQPDQSALSGTASQLQTGTVNGSPAAVFNDLSVSTAGSYEFLATTAPTTSSMDIDPAYGLVSNTFQIASAAPPPATVGLSWQPAQLNYGPLPASELNATATENGSPSTGTFVYTFTATGATINVGQTYPAGTYGVQVAYTPTDQPGQTYTEGTQLTISPATPVVALAIPPALLPGATLSVTNVHASATGVGGATLGGTFSYSQALGSVPSAGQQSITATFTPTDSTDYTTATASANFTVLSPAPTTTSLTANPVSALAGSSVSLLANVAPASGGAGAVAGTVQFTYAAGASVGTGKLAMDQSTASLFAEPVQTFPSNGTFTTRSADFNGDGMADLLVVTGGEYLQLLLSQADTATPLAASIQLDLGSACTATSDVVVGDVNGDGLPDIVASCESSDDSNRITTLVVLLNQGNGSFTTTSINAPASLYPGTQLVLGDFNNDGFADLVALSPSCSGAEEANEACIVFFAGNGTGSFSAGTPELIDSSQGVDPINSPVAADFNHDGLLDLAFIRYSAAGGFETEVWQNDGGSSPTFGVSATDSGCSGSACYAANSVLPAANSSSVPTDLVTADFNEDGLPDLALINSNASDPTQNTYSIALNTSSGGTTSFPAATTDTTFSGAIQLVAADFDGDGFPDLAVYSTADSSVKVLHGAGDGTFSVTAPGLSAALTTSVSSAGSPILAVGDVNGDGYPDLLAAAPSAGVGASQGTAEQLVTSGATAASALTTAPAAASATYSATTQPVSYWSASTGSTTVDITVPASSIQLTASANTITYGGSVTLTATVTGEDGSSASVGTATFNSDGAAIGSAPVTNGVASFTAGSFTAGTHVLTVTYSNSATGQTLSAGGIDLTVNKATPTLSWATPAPITTSTPLSGAQLDAMAAGVTGAPLPGSFTYTPSSGTLSAGAHTLSASFAPTDSVDYAASTVQTILQVNAPTAASISLGESANPITYGQSVTLLATVTGSDGQPFSGGTATFTADGTTLGSVTVASGTASLAVSSLTAGTHALGVSYTNTTTNQTLTGSASLTVNKAAPALSWATPAPIQTTTPLSGTQLDATATGVTGAALPGTFSYNPAAGTTLTAGAHTLTATFTPTDTADYSTGTVQTTLQATTPTASSVVLGESANPITFGQSVTLTATVTGSDGKPLSGGTATFTSDGTTLGSAAVANGVASLAASSLTAGTHALGVSYTNAATAQTLTATASLVVNKAVPTLNWPAPAPIATSTPLSATQLDATATGVTGAALPGTFSYNPAAGTTLTAGAHTLATTFTPTDTTDYSTATAQTTLQVNAPTAASIALQESANPITFGQSLTLQCLVTGSDGKPLSGGTATFTSDGTMLGSAAVKNGSLSLVVSSLKAGLHQLGVTYTNTETNQTLTSSASLTVNKAAPAVTWAAPTAITTSTPLSPTQLDATVTGVTGAALPGAFVYNPAAGTTLTAGTHILSTTFTPTDTTDYGAITAQTTLQVSDVPVKLVSLLPASTTFSVNPVTVTLTGAGYTSTTVAEVNGTPIATRVLSATSLSATIPASDLTAAATLNLSTYDSSTTLASNTLPFAVTAPTANVTLTVPPTTGSDQQPTIGLTLGSPYPVPITGTFVLTFAPNGDNGVDDPNIQFSTGGRTLTFTIPAGSTTAPQIALQTGTVAGVITVTLNLTAGGSNITPANITPVVITIAPAAPTITSVTFTNVNGLLTVVTNGFSNTRETTDANFTFTGSGAPDLSASSLQVTADQIFATWFTTPGSDVFGSAFSYTQTFELSSPDSSITGVSVTLSNTVGISASVNSQ